MPHLDHTAAVSDTLTELVYELLDAHADTLALAREVGSAPQWSAHLDYLRGLQRVGRETLAHLGQ